jgi:NADPH:quinone reductase-like Zn-dependent oxidoreductase
MRILRDLLETGQLTPVVDGVYPLARVHEAFRRLIEGANRGKVILAP